MTQSFDPKRRAISAGAALALLGFPLITITSGCGGSDSPSSPSSPPPTTNPPAQGDAVGSISANHGHSAVITAATLAAGGAVMGMSIRGTSNHDHTIELSAAQVVSIRDRGRVSVESTNNDSHTHTVTFN